MTQFLPDSWRQALTRLRADIQEVLERWFHKRTEGLPRHPEAGRKGPAELVPTYDPWWSPGGGSLDLWRAAGAPALDIEETDEAVIVVADLPGLAEEDIKVELTGERLVIRGTKQRQAERQERGYVYAERSYGAFARALTLPCEVDPDRTQAQYTHGVLRVTMPKTARARARSVPIRVHSSSTA